METICMWSLDAWAWLNVNGGGLGALAGVATAVVAVVALTRTTNDSRARSRPMVTAELKLAPDSDTSMILAIENRGPTPARNVKVTFDPPLPTDAPEHSSATYMVRRYSKPLPVLNPGQALTNTWWSGRATSGPELENAEPTPDEVTVTIEYDGVGRKRLVDVYPLHVDTVALTTQTISSTSFKGRMKTIAEKLSRVADEMKAIRQKLAADD